MVGVQTPDLRLKVDPGSKTTGVAIVNQETGEVIFAAEIGRRGQAIKKSLVARRAIRRGRRSRKTRYREPRFDDRRRSEGFLPPSLESRVENVFTWSRRLIRIYPVIGLGLELVKFDKWLTQNLEIEGVEYQQGELEGFELREYELIKFNYNCAYAGDDSSCIVKADIPRGEYAGRYVGRVTIRQRPSFILNGFDKHPKYLKRIHRSDGYEYQGQSRNGSRAEAKRQKAHGHSTSPP